MLLTNLRWFWLIFEKEMQTTKYSCHDDLSVLPLMIQLYSTKIRNCNKWWEKTVLLRFLRCWIITQINIHSSSTFSFFSSRYRVKTIKHILYVNVIRINLHLEKNKFQRNIPIFWKGLNIKLYLKCEFQLH